MSQILDQYLAANDQPQPFDDVKLGITTGQQPQTLTGAVPEPLSVDPPNKSILDEYNSANEDDAKQALKAQGRDLWKKWIDRKIELPDPMIHDLYQTAWGDSTPLDSLKEAGKGAGDFVSKAWDYLFKPGGVDELGEKVGGAIKTGYQGISKLLPFTHLDQGPEAKSNEQRQAAADAISSAYNFGSGFIPLAVDTLGGIDNLLNYATGWKGAAKQREQNIIDAAKTHRLIGQSQANLQENLGANPESDVGKTISTAAMMLPIGGAEAGTSELIAKASRGIEEGLTKLPARAVQGAAYATEKVGPAVAAYELAKHGHWLESIGSLVAGYGGDNIGWLGKLKRAIIDDSFDKAGDVAKLIAERPEGQTITETLKNDVDSKIKNLIEQEADKRASVKGPLEVDKMDSSGGPLYDPDKLKGVDKEIWNIKAQREKLQRRSEMLGNYVELNKMLKDAGKLGIATTLHTGEAAGALGGMAGVQAQTPEDIRPAVEQGMETGAQYGGPLSPIAALGGMKTLRVNEAREALTHLGNNFIKDDPLYGLHQKTVANLPPEIQQRIAIQNGFGAALGPDGPKTIVLPDKEINKLFTADDSNVALGGTTQTGEENPVVNGFYNGKNGNIYIAESRAATGTWGHEFTHAWEASIGSQMVKALPEIEKKMNDPAISPFYKNFAENYVKGMRDTLGKYPALTDGQLSSEALAEIGRLTLGETPPELLYGGETGTDIFKRKLKEGIQNQEGQKVDPLLGVPYTRGDIGRVKQQLYGVGEEAKRQAQGVSGQPDLNKNESTGIVEPSGGVQANISEAKAALQQLGSSATTAKERAQAAYDELAKEGGDLSTESVVKRALQKNIPKPINLGEPVKPPLGAAEVHMGIEQGKIKGPEDLGKLMEGRDIKFMPNVQLDKNLDAAVQDYAKRTGLKYTPHTEYRPLTEDYSKRIADSYDKLVHNPDNPEVQKAYDAFRDGILEQYKALTDHGYKIEPWPNEGQPYANSAEMLKDLRENKHLYYFRTEIGYGNKGGSTAIQHPMLRGSGIKFGDQEAPINDIFRGVHDALGHGIMGYQFGPRGEYNAFLAHASTLPPESWPALATETIGQNSWTNAGPHMRNEEGKLFKKGEKGYIELQDRPFTEQRANLLNFAPDVIMPHEVSGTNSRPVSLEEFNQLRDKGKAKLEEFKTPVDTKALDKNWDAIKDRAWNEVQKNWGGLAVDTSTGEPNVGPIGKGGEVGKGPFGVTAKEPGQATIELPDTVSREEFDKAMERARKEFPQLGYKDHNLSVFHDDNKKTIDIDPTVIVKDKGDAEAIAAYTHAIGGIYDFDTGNGLYPPHVDTKNTPLSDLTKHMAMPVTESKPENNYSWLDRSGNFTPVKTNHGRTAWEMLGSDTNMKGGDALQELWRKGYVRVAHSGPDLLAHLDREHATGAQLTPSQRKALIVQAEDTGKERVIFDNGDSSHLIWSRDDSMAMPSTNPNPIDSPAGQPPEQRFMPRDAYISHDAGPYHEDDMKAIVSQDPSERGKWRVTYFDDENQPLGHFVYTSKQEAVSKIGKDRLDARGREARKFIGSFEPDPRMKFMPSTNPIDSPAVRADGITFRGITWKMAEKAARDFGVQGEIKKGFVTRRGEWKTPEEARSYGEETGQFPESLKDSLTDTDFHLKAMPNVETGEVTKIERTPDRYYAVKTPTGPRIVDRLTGERHLPDLDHEADSIPEQVAQYNSDNEPLPKSWPNITKEERDAIINPPEPKINEFKMERAKAFEEKSHEVKKEIESMIVKGKQPSEDYVQAPGRFDAWVKKDDLEKVNALKKDQMRYLDIYFRLAKESGEPDKPLLLHDLTIDTQATAISDGLTPEEAKTYEAIKKNPEPTTEEADEFSRLTDKINEHIDKYGSRGSRAMPWVPTDEEVKKIKEGGRITTAARWDNMRPGDRLAELEKLFPNRENNRKLADKRFSGQIDQEALRKALPSFPASELSSPRAMPALPVQKDGTSKAWISPDGEIIPIKGLHYQYLKQNPEVAKEWGLNPANISTDGDTLDAVKNGAVRVNFGRDGIMHIEATKSAWTPAVRDAAKRVAMDNADYGVMGVRVSLFNDDLSKQVGGENVRINADPAKVEDMSIFSEPNKPDMSQSMLERNGLGGIDLGKGMDWPTEDSENYFGKSNKAMPATKDFATLEKQYNEDNPDAIPMRYKRNENGDIKLVKGKPVPEQIPYAITSTPEALKAVEGVQGGAARKEAIQKVLSDKIEQYYHEVKDHPEISKARGWYREVREKIRPLFDNDEDAWLFCQLLGVTSAGEKPRPNLEYAIDAYNSIKSGRFDDIKARAQKHLDEGTFVNNHGWLEKNGLLPTMEKLTAEGTPSQYGKNSSRVLQVLLGNWFENAPLKTGDYAANFAHGRTVKAVIDQWAARTARRLLGGQRIAPMSETGVTPTDYKLVQAAFHDAADRVGESPDDLQALLWFAEKHHWEEQGFTHAGSTHKGDIRPLLRNTVRTPEGMLNLAEIPYEAMSKKEKKAYDLSHAQVQ